MKDKLYYKLCYIDNIDDWTTFKLYFTSKFDDQWGDDWDDRPASCNAGEPYTENRNIFTLILDMSSSGQVTFGGKIYSVNDLNTKKACWLIYEDVFFNGGDTLEEILNKIKEYNSRVDEYNNIKIYFECGDDFNANS